MNEGAPAKPSKEAVAPRSANATAVAAADLGQVEAAQRPSRWRRLVQRARPAIGGSKWLPPWRDCWASHFRFGCGNGSF